MIKDPKSDNKKFIFHHISTDEVYGDLNEDDEGWVCKTYVIGRQNDLPDI